MSAKTTMTAADVSDEEKAGECQGCEERGEDAEDQMDDEGIGSGNGSKYLRKRMPQWFVFGTSKPRIPRSRATAKRPTTDRPTKKVVGKPTMNSA